MTWTDALDPRRLDLYNYSTYQSRVLRIISITSCSTSLVACFLMYYTFFAIHPTRRKFRHQLIFFLVTFDFLKVIAMSVFPILTYVNPEEVGQKTINFLGFFTAFSIEGGDLAILSFAIHTFLTIFNPRRTGGLYFLRYYVYVCSVLIPMLLAGLAFIAKGEAYTTLTVFCYLPVTPISYRIALSWGPRYFIMFAILLIYCSIYFYVMNQLKKMETSHGEGLPVAEITEDQRCRTKVLNIHKMISQRILPQHASCQPQQQQEEQGEEAPIERPKRENTTINMELQLENSQRLKTRYKVIARQIKIIFLYPLAYFILWIFPMIQFSLQLRHMSSYPISFIVAFMTPLNGVVDTIVYLYREKPWQLTYSNTPRSPFLQEEPISKWRQWVSFLPLYSLPNHQGQQGSTLVGAMEAKMLTQNTNALMASINPEEFLHTPTTSSFDDVTQSSAAYSSSKRKLSTVSSTGGEDKEGDEMDFMDFLNKGPPV